MDSEAKNYSHHLEELIKAVAEKDINRIRQCAQKSLQSARVLKQPHLEITVLCMAATGFLSLGQLAIALTVYDEAAKIDTNALMNGADKDLYELLSVQIVLYKGSALLTQKTPQYPDIIEVYQQAADKAQQLIAEKGQKENVDLMNGGILHLYLFEALRILGFSQEQLGRQQAALKYYIKAVSALEKMNSATRKSTLAPTVGKALLNLCRKLGMKNEYFVVIDKMNGLIGEGWEKENINKK